MRGTIRPAPARPMGLEAGGRLLARTAAFLAAALIGAIALAINADVLARVLFTRPLRGVAELVAIAMPATVFLVLAWTSRDGGLLRAGRALGVDAPALSTWQEGREAAMALAAALLAALIAAVNLPWGWRAWRDAEFLGVAGDFTVPAWPAYAAVVAGSALLAGFLGMDGWRWMRRLVRRAGLRAGVLSVACLGLPPLLYLPCATPAMGLVSVALLFALLLLGCRSPSLFGGAARYRVPERMPALPRPVWVSPRVGRWLPHVQRSAVVRVLVRARTRRHRSRCPGRRALAAARPRVTRP